MEGLSARLACYCAMVRRFRRAAGLTAERDDRRMTLKMAIEPLLALRFLTATPQTLLDVGRDPAKAESWPVVVSRAAMKPAKMTAVVGKSMPGTSRLILFLSSDGAKEAGSGPHFRLKEQVSLPWRPSSLVALFERDR